MTSKVGPKGQVVIPKAIRDRLGIGPGDDVEIERVDGEVRIHPAQPQPRLRGLLKRDPPDRLTAGLEADHRWEIAHDEMRIAEWQLRELDRAGRRP
jgi:AbrB family looped-hinge helix DNA binding protein